MATHPSKSVRMIAYPLPPLPRFHNLHREKQEEQRAAQEIHDVARIQHPSREIAVVALDAQGLYDVVSHENISMCGYQPTTSTIIASKDLGATQAELVKYQTSGEVTRNFHEVVGYAGIRIF